MYTVWTMKAQHLTTVLFVLCTFASGQGSFFQNETDLVDAMVRTVMGCKNIPGMSVSMVRGDDFFAKGYGHARLDPPLNWTSQTPAYLGSVGKAITSALLGILMTEKRNTADRRLKYLPSLGEFRNSWIYNNLLYAMAGHVAQVRTGQPYENLINNKIIGPLGMRQASCGTMIYPTSSQTNYALPYHLKNGKLEVGDSRIYQIGDLVPAGCLIASAEDLGKWVQFMASGGKNANQAQLIHPDLFREIINPQRLLDDLSVSRFSLDSDYPVNASGTWYGLGWYGGDYRGHKRLFNPGNRYGYSAVVGFFPDKNAGFSISINGPWYNNYRTDLAPLSYVLSDIILGESQWLDNNTICSFPAPWKNPASNSSSTTTQPPVESVPIESKTQYLGTYGSRVFGTMTIGQINDQVLSFQMNSAGIGNLSMISRADGTFRMIFNELLNDVVGSDCSLQFISYNGTVYGSVRVLYECFYTVYDYHRGVNFVELEDKPSSTSASAAASLSKWSTLIFCLFVALPLMRSGELA
uniref:Beta-lactamase-related domain-containing protein n=1 Tax=Magallana gigas TaxID=29159 RepID=K1QIV4_MAGGI